MWKKFLHLRPHFVGMTIILTVIVAHSGIFSSLLFTVVWSFGNFILPHFNRFRPAPMTALTPTVTPAFKLMREISGTLSTRLGQLSTRSSRLAQSLLSTRSARSTRSTGGSAARLRRLSQLRKASGSTRGNMSTRSIFSTGPMSTRSNLMSPRNSIWEGEELELNSSVNFNLVKTPRPRRDSFSLFEEDTDNDVVDDVMNPSPDSVPEAPLWKSTRKAKQKEQQLDEIKTMIQELQKQVLENAASRESRCASGSEDGKSAPEDSEDEEDKLFCRDLTRNSSKGRRSRPSTPSSDEEAGPLDIRYTRSAPLPRSIAPLPRSIRA